MCSRATPVIEVPVNQTTVKKREKCFTLVLLYGNYGFHAPHVNLDLSSLEAHAPVELLCPE